MVEATKACRILRTRCDAPRRRRFFVAVFFFLAAVDFSALTLLPDFLLEREGFCGVVCASNWHEGSSQTLATRKRITAIAANKRRPNSTLALSPKIGAHHRDVIFRKAADDFVRKIVSAGCGGVSVALVERRTALLDVFFQPVVDVVVLPSF